MADKLTRQRDAKNRRIKNILVGKVIVVINDKLSELGGKRR